MEKETKDKLVNHVNKHKWWRTSVPEEKEVSDRGMFFASSYRDAEFYGKPINEPFNVSISNPLVGDEQYIMAVLELDAPSQDISVKDRFALDAKIKNKASKMGYDSIVLMTTKGYERYRTTGAMPRSIELNVIKT